MEEGVIEVKKRAAFVQKSGQILEEIPERIGEASMQSNHKLRQTKNRPAQPAIQAHEMQSLAARFRL